jgi:hypothetical protein
MENNQNNQLCDLLADAGRDREKVRLLVIGSPEGIMDVMRSLHARGYAEVGAWSQIVPIPEKGAFMSILTRQRSRS